MQPNNLTKVRGSRGIKGGADIKPDLTVSRAFVCSTWRDVLHVSGHLSAFSWDYMENFEAPQKKTPGPISIVRSHWMIADQGMSFLLAGLLCATPNLSFKKATSHIAIDMLKYTQLNFRLW